MELTAGGGFPTQQALGGLHAGAVAQRHQALALLPHGGVVDVAQVAAIQADPAGPGLVAPEHHIGVGMHGGIEDGQVALTALTAGKRGGNAPVGVLPFHQHGAQAAFVLAQPGGVGHHGGAVREVHMGNAVTPVHLTVNAGEPCVRAGHRQDPLGVGEVTDHGEARIHLGAIGDIEHAGIVEADEQVAAGRPGVGAVTGQIHHLPIIDHMVRRRARRRPRGKQPARQQHDAPRARNRAESVRRFHFLFPTTKKIKRKAPWSGALFLQTSSQNRFALLPRILSGKIRIFT